MPTELHYLVLSVILYLVMIVMQAVAAVLSRKTTISELVGPRDALPPAGLTPFHGRARRAQANMTEGMIMFIPLVFAVLHTGGGSELSALGAALFFFARLAFAPLYWFGVAWLRTAAWAVSILGLILLLVELFT